MSAVRVARAATKRDKIVKFEGCYHGHADSFLVQAGSGAMTLGVPTSPGVPAAAARRHAARALQRSRVGRSASFAQHRGPDRRASSSSRSPATWAWCRRATDSSTGLRDDLRSRTASLLIFDEVISGFRAAAGGAQQVFGVRPDLTCLGKIIGGGLPVGAYGGRADMMELVAPAGPGLPGGHAVGESARDDGRAVVARGAVAEAVQAPREARRAAGRRPRRRRARRGRAAAGQRVRLAADAVLHRRSRCATSSRR